MSGTFPTTGFTVMNFKSNTTTRITTTLSGKTLRQALPSQFFSFKLQSPPLTRAEFQPVMAFIMKQNGKFDSFTIIPPLVNDASGTAGGTITVNATYAAGSSTVKANGGTGTLKAGDMIKFSNHNKVYMVTADVDMDASSVDTIEIFPSLREAVSNTTTIQYDDVPFEVFMTSDVMEYQVGSTQLFTYEIDVREEL